MKDVMFINPISKPITYPGIMKGRYMITEYGHVVDIQTNHIIQPFVNTYGYLQIRLLNENYGISLPLISRLVAYEFCKENLNLNLQVDHIDSNKLNNHYSNLEWVSNFINIRRAYENRLASYKSYKTDEQIYNICQLLSTTNLPFREVCRLAGLNVNENQAKGLCSDIISRKYWNHISNGFDFTSRLNKVHRLTEEEKNRLNKLIDLPMNKIYEEYSGLKWEDLSRSERDKFRHSIDRLKRSSSTIP